MVEIINFIGIAAIMCTLLILSGWAENERHFSFILYIILAIAFGVWCLDNYDFAVRLQWGN